MTLLLNKSLLLLGLPCYQFFSTHTHTHTHTHIYIYICQNGRKIYVGTFDDLFNLSSRSVSTSKFCPNTKIFYQNYFKCEVYNRKKKLFRWMSKRVSMMNKISHQIYLHISFFRFTLLYLHSVGFNSHLLTYVSKQVPLKRADCFHSKILK